MTTKRKWILWSVLVVIIGGLAFLGFCIAAVPRVVRDCYGQWATAELAINYHRDHGRLPTHWQQLEAVYGDGQGLHHGGMSFAQLGERIVVAFGRLPELEALARSTSSVATLPEIIYTKSGQQSHYSGAEPNRMVYDYLRERQQERLKKSLQPTPGSGSDSAALPRQP